MIAWNHFQLDAFQILSFSTRGLQPRQWLKILTAVVKKRKFHFALQSKLAKI